MNEIFAIDGATLTIIGISVTAFILCWCTIVKDYFRAKNKSDHEDK
ncbi:MAG: hypothetical protein RR922_05820 [Clostridia bacterium]